MILKLILFITLTKLSCSISLPKNFDFNIKSIHNLLNFNSFNCTDIVKIFIDRSVKYNLEINAIINFNPNIFQQAYDLDVYYHKNKKFKGLLHCVPFGIKDNIDVLGLPTTGGIKALRYSYPNKDAEVISLLKSQGALILFKTNMGELAYGNLVSELGGECKNPFDSTRSCGPSSFGSGASVSSGLAIVSLGTDSSGSILTPGSFNGLYSLRPAMNTTSLNGVIPLFEKVDTIGPLAKYLDDLVLTFSVIMNNDTIWASYNEKLDNSKLKIGIFSNIINNFTIDFVDKSKYPTNYLIDPEVNESIKSTIIKLKSLGFKLIEFGIDDTEFQNFLKLLLDVYDSSSSCISSSKKKSMDLYFNDPIRFQHDAPIKNFMDLYQSPVLSQYWKNDFNISLLSEKNESLCSNYDQKSKVFREYMTKIFDSQGIDTIMFPTSITLPDLLNSTDSNLLTSMIILSAFSGYSALNIPVGYSKISSNAIDGLPIGMILMTKPDKMMDSFRIAKSYENSYGNAKLPSRMALTSGSKISHSNLILILSIITFYFIY